jgi:plasmid replication initiation protein
MAKNSLVVQSNELIEASYRLSLIEAKVILKIASMIKREDKVFDDYHISAKTLMKEINLGERNYAELKKATEGLVSKTATLKESDGDLQISFLASAKHYTKGVKKGMIRFRLDPGLKPYLLQLKKKFTSFRLENTLNLRSIYAIRIYELLKQYEAIKKRSIQLQDFREILGLKDTEYKLYGHFKTRIILPAQRELKKKTDLSFEFEEIKTGRSVTDIVFHIYPNKEQEKLLDLFEDVLVRKMEKVVVFSLSKMRDIIERYNDEKIEIALKYTKEKAAKNKEAYFIKLLEDENFGLVEIEARKKREKREEKENKEYIKREKEEAEQQREKEEIKQYIKKFPKIFQKFIKEFQKINGEKFSTLSEKSQKSMAENYARIEILKEIRK